MARRRKGRAVSGWLVIDKPAGIGSTQVVGRLRRALGARKAGHAGTLDPDATGLLAVALGEATKTVPVAQDGHKTYAFTVRFGAETATDDAAGEITGTSDARPDDDAIRAALPALTGDILQVPPSVSAVHVDGRRAYDLAREGEMPELAARPLHVAALTMTGRPDPDTAHLEMTCGKGGYVRSIARDLGRALGARAHVLTLRRTAAGPFALPAPSLEEAEADPEAHLMPVEAALAGWPRLTATAEGAVRLAHGNPGECIGDAEAGALAYAVRDGHALAMGRWMGGMLHPTRVFVASEP